MKACLVNMQSCYIVEQL